jgi:hypothetical protein
MNVAGNETHFRTKIKGSFVILPSYCKLDIGIPGPLVLLHYASQYFEFTIGLPNILYKAASCDQCNNKSDESAAEQSTEKSYGRSSRLGHFSAIDCRSTVEYLVEVPHAMNSSCVKGSANPTPKQARPLE